jgi:hypothetical protein
MCEVNTHLRRVTHNTPRLRAPAAPAPRGNIA